MKKIIKENIIRLARESAFKTVNLLNEEFDKIIKAQEEDEDNIDTDSMLDIYHEGYHIFETYFENAFDKFVVSNAKRKNDIFKA